VGDGQKEKSRPQVQNGSQPATIAPAASGLPSGFSSRMVVAECDAVLYSAPEMKPVLLGVTGEPWISARYHNTAPRPFCRDLLYPRNQWVRFQPPRDTRRSRLRRDILHHLRLEDALIQGGTSSNIGAMCSTEFWTRLFRHFRQEDTYSFRAHQSSFDWFRSAV